MSVIAASALALGLSLALGAAAVAAGVAAWVAVAAGIGDVEAVLEQAARTMASDAIGRIRKRFMVVRSFVVGTSSLLVGPGDLVSR